MAGLGQAQREYAESLSETPSVLRYSDLIKVGTPIADTQIHTLIPSNGGTFQPNQTIRIPFNIPTDSFANLKGAYLNFRINNNGTKLLYFDPIVGAASCIDTWRIVSGTGALLEEIQHYPVIYGICADMVSEDHRQTHLGVMERSSNDPTQTGYGGEAVGYTGTGQNLKVVRANNIITHSSYQKVSHKPMSGLFNADRLAPLGFSTGTSYIEITLPSDNAPFCNDVTDSGVAQVWTISEVQLIVPVLRMGAEFNASFRQLLSSGIPINWHSTSWHNVQSNLASGSVGATTITMSARKRSVKSIITTMRKTDDLTADDVDSNTARRSGGVTNWSYTIGGVKYPSADVTQLHTTTQTGVKDMGGTFAQLQNCFANLGNIYTGTCITQENFISTQDTTLASKVSYGLDLESYGHSDVQSGKNMAGQGLPIVFQPTLGDSATNNCFHSKSGIVDCFLLYDVIYTLDGVSGTISASS